MTATWLARLSDLVELARPRRGRLPVMTPANTRPSSAKQAAPIAPAATARTTASGGDDAGCRRALMARVGRLSCVRMKVRVAYRASRPVEYDPGVSGAVGRRLIRCFRSCGRVDSSPGPDQRRDA